MNNNLSTICSALGIAPTEDINIIVSHIQVLKQSFVSQVSRAVNLPVGIQKEGGVEIKVEGEGPLITG